MRCVKLLVRMVKRSFSLDRAFRHLLQLFAVCWFAAPAFAAAATTSLVATHLLRPGVPAIADLDGDHLPDVASGISTGHTPAGYSYRVDLDLSGHTNQNSFSVLSEEPNGLNIEAIDIDGDHDLDLVITNRLSLKPIGVWINDGTGSFTPGDLGQYVFVAWQNRDSVRSPILSSAPVLQFEWRRPQIALRHNRIDFSSAVSMVRGGVSPFFFSTQAPDGSTHLRAPPGSIL